LPTDSRLKAFYYTGSWKSIDDLFGPAEQARLNELFNFIAPPQTIANFYDDPAPWREVEVLIAGWGVPMLTEEMEAALVNLKAIFHAGGSSKRVASANLLRHGVVLSSTYAANAIPVAEYTLAHILFGLKSGWQHVAWMRQHRAKTELPLAGAFGSTVGLVSLGMIGRTVVELLRPHDLRVLAYDPYLSADEAARLGVETGSLEDVFRRGDVVSLHTPWLPETEGLITGAHLALMKPYSTFINTSRGAVVREDEMIAVLQARPDLTAVLDVTYPEPPEPDSPLWTLSNVILTPHIAGALGREARRMGQFALQEIERWLAGQELRWRILPEQLPRLA